MRRDRLTRAEARIARANVLYQSALDERRAARAELRAAAREYVAAIGPAGGVALAAPSEPAKPRPVGGAAIVAALLRPEEAAHRLGISRTRVYGLIARGELSSVKFGRVRRVFASSVDAWVARHDPEPPRSPPAAPPRMGP